MTLVVDLFRTLLPSRAKSSPSGWTSFNAPCCQHRGHKPDTRKRAGVRFDSGIVYNCFNCKFSTGWQPGSPLGEKMKTLCKWLGASDDEIKKLVFESIKTESKDYVQSEYSPTVDFEGKTLPEGSLPLSQWADFVEGDTADVIGEDFVKILDYLIERGYDNPLEHDFYWSPTDGYIDRVIIPFYWQGRIVGNTARKVKDGRPKYLSDQHPNFVFNYDKQNEAQKFVIVCEGPFDALAIDGVALLTNDISEQQYRIINSLGAEVIVVPDQDKAGLNLYNRCLEYDWSVATPTWEYDIKDCADAVRRYGKLFVLVDILMNRQKGSIKINLAKKKLEQKIAYRLLSEDKND
jgi:hypothetical protein